VTWAALSIRLVQERSRACPTEGVGGVKAARTLCWAWLQPRRWCKRKSSVRRQAGEGVATCATHCKQHESTRENPRINTSIGGVLRLCIGTARSRPLRDQRELHINQAAGMLQAYAALSLLQGMLRDGWPCLRLSGFGHRELIGQLRSFDG